LAGLNVKVIDQMMEKADLMHKIRMTLVCHSEADLINCFKVRVCNFIFHTLLYLLVRIWSTPLLSSPPSYSVLTIFSPHVSPRFYSNALLFSPPLTPQISITVIIIVNITIPVTTTVSVSVSVPAAISLDCHSNMTTSILHR
jgi:hypothetical protein